MLKVLDTVLGDLKLVPLDSAICYYITLSRGDTISIRAFLSPDLFLQIKVSEFVDLREEYEAYVRAWKLYGQLVPRPLGYRLLQGWAVRDQIRFAIGKLTRLQGQPLSDGLLLLGVNVLFFTHIGDHHHPHVLQAPHGAPRTPAYRNHCLETEQAEPAGMESP